MLLLTLTMFACRPSDRPMEESAPPVPDTTLPGERIDPVVVFVQGDARFAPAGSDVWAPLELGMILGEGARLATGDDGSAELTFGAFAVVRLLPGTATSLEQLRSRGFGEHGRDGVELSLDRGALLAKVRKLSGRDEFIVTTANSTAGVRGTEFLIRYEGAVPAGTSAAGWGELTRVSVRDGTVAVLPRGPLLTGLLDGREVNPLAGAVVSTALALGPAAKAGQEVIVGGDAAAAAGGLAFAEESYGALVYAAEGVQAAGLDLEEMEIQDQAALLAGPDSALNRRLEALSLRFPAAAASAESLRLLELLDRLRDPGAEESKLPAALPAEFFAKAAADAGSGPRTVAPVLTYPAVQWTAALSARPIAEGITRVGSLVLALGGDGRAHALDGTGKRVWSAGEGVQNLTALDAAVVLMQKDALVVVDGSDGSERGRYALDGWAAPPQSKAVPVPEGLAMATPRGVMILRQENAQVLREIPVPGGIAAPMVLAGRTLVGVSGTGGLVLMDVAAGRVSAEIDAGLGNRPYGPRYKDGRIYAADYTGRVVAADLEAAALLWARDLGVGIRAEPELDERALFLWTADKTLMRLSVADGSDLGSPLGGVESPPLLSKGRLYWGGPLSTLVTADAATGAVLSSVAVPELPAVRPLMVDGVLYIGTSKGRLLRMKAEGR